MFRFIIKRLLILIPTILGVAFLVTLFITLTPGDPVELMCGPDVSAEEKAAMREEMGLNDPFFVRYIHFLNGVIHGDLGNSYRTGKPVVKEMVQRFPYTLLLVASSMILSLIVGIPVGIYAAVHQYSWKDNLAIFLCLFFVSMPSFWFALLLVRLLSVKWKLLPVAGVESWTGWILPVIISSLTHIASIARQTRSNMLEVIRQDYITTARAKGCSERTVRYRHALKNAIIPVIMIVGTTFGVSLGGSMVFEQIFSIPGLGIYSLSAMSGRDYPVIQASVLFQSTMFAVVLLLIDVAFAIVDPRIRVQYAARRKKKKAAPKPEAESAAA